MSHILSRVPYLFCLTLTALFASGGCRTVQPYYPPPSVLAPMPSQTAMPRELSKVVLPTYTIEPPDILMIDAIHIVPRAPYRLRTSDVLSIQMRRTPTDKLRAGDVVAIQAPGALSEAPIDGLYPIQQSGMINLGLPYGSVKVGGMTIDEAKKAIQQHLETFLRDPSVSVTLGEQAVPIDGTYPVQLGGMIDLGLPYGTVKVVGMTVDEAKKAIEEHLRQFFVEPTVSVTLAEIAAKQQITGEHLVGPDGTVTLGTYGSVSVVGLTLAEAKAAIERHLSESLEEPEVSVDVYAYNSKVYYLVTQGAGLGDGLYRFPVTGNETVLDAISNINGLEQVSSKRIWIARPTPDPQRVQILPVDWEAITAQASASSNYQILPGDRIFVSQDSWIALDSNLAKFTAPLERVMGFAMLGVGTITRFSGPVLRGGGNPRGTF